MEPRSRVCIAVRNLLPRSTRNDRSTTTETGGERIGDEAIANPGVDPLALVTDRGGLGLALWLDNSRLDGTGLSTTPVSTACSSRTEGSTTAPSIESVSRAPYFGMMSRFPSRTTVSSLSSGSARSSTGSFAHRIV
jgi:hypothetical protein